MLCEIVMVAHFGGKKCMKMEKGRAALGRENGEFKGWVFSGKR